MSGIQEFVVFGSLLDGFEYSLVSVTAEVSVSTVGFVGLVPFLLLLLCLAH